MGKTSTFEIIAGTYEEFLLGYHFIAKGAEIIQSFAAHDHSSSVRCVAQSGQYLATGAADDRIFIYDLKIRKEHCMLTNHESTVNTVSFTIDHSHVISGSNDGTIAIVRVGNWQLEKLWKEAHKGAVYDIAVHSTGKLALSLGADCTLRTWNLVKGRLAYAINLTTKSKDPKSLEKVVWAPDDVRFVMYGGRYTEIWSIETGGIVKIIEHDKKVASCLWIDDENLFVGYENGNVATIEIDSNEKNEKKAHDGRVRNVAFYKKWIVSASSGGEIKIWNKNLEELAKVNSGCRVTCLVIVPPINKIKIEDENEIPEVVEEVKPVKKSKSRVVIEVEESDKEEEATVKKIKKKKRKRNEKFAVEEIESFQPIKVGKKQQAVKSVAKKKKKFKNKLKAS